ncbi:MAG: hypothetical protein DRJ38_01640 [Thermoprotei archaeon]|nr:MAG: hypothetical protein DRJ38_01640 [Thermoprotei archaeon]
MSERYLGVLCGIGSAFFFSLAALFYKKGFSKKKMDVFLANGLRAIPTFCILLTASFIIGNLHELYKIEILFYAFLSLFVDLILGDTFFFLALKESPLSIAYPISYSFSLFAAIFSTFFLEEPVTVYLLTSIIVLITGIYLIYRGSNGETFKVKGVLYSLLTAFFWGSSVVFTKTGLYHSTPITFNLARTAILSIITTPYTVSRREQVVELGRFLKYVIIGGFLGMGLGPLLFYLSIISIGASRASVLASSTPILSLILATLVLRERVQRKQLIGILLVILSTYLVSIS